MIAICRFTMLLKYVMISANKDFCSEYCEEILKSAFSELTLIF